MAINIHCQNCKSSIRLSAKKCSKCKTPVPKKNKKYRVIVRINGTRKTKLVSNLELARDLEKKMKIDDVRKEFDIYKKKASITLDEFWEKYLPWLMENKKSWKTDVYYYNRHLHPTFGNKKLDSITPFTIESFVVKMKKNKSRRGKSYAPATIKHQLVLLTRLYNVAKNWGMFSGDNPCRRVKKPKLNNQVTEFLSDDELNSLLDVLEKWDNKMSTSFILFGLYTGIRRGELFKLTWNDINFNRQFMVLRDPKGIADQTLPLSDKAVNVLKNAPKEYDTQWIFYGRNGQQRTDFKGPWLRIKKAAGLPKNFRFHGIRHHFASSLVSHGTDLYTVQKLLCHKDASTTQRYAHLADHTLREAVKLSDRLQQTKKPIINLEDRLNG